MADKLKEKIDLYNEEHGQEMAKYIQLENEKFAIVFVDKMNLRTHEQFRPLEILLFWTQLLDAQQQIQKYCGL